MATITIDVVVLFVSVAGQHHAHADIERDLAGLRRAIGAEATMSVVVVLVVFVRSGNLSEKPLFPVGEQNLNSQAG